MINIVNIILCFIFLLYNLKLFQQSSYFISRNYLNYYYKNYKFLFIYIIILIINIIFKIYILKLFLFIFLTILLIYIINKKRILKINFTKRLIRLLIVSTILLLISNYILNTYSLLIINIIIYASNLLLFPLERFIYNKYKQKLKMELKRFNGVKIVITGSYAKTTTKHMLKDLLSYKYNVFYTEKSYNTPMGLAKSIIGNLNNLYDICILEFGACKKNDIKELMELDSYDLAILTGISNQHLDTFKTLNNIINEKMNIIELLDSKGIGIINCNCQLINDYNIKNNCKVIKYYNNDKEKIYYKNVNTSNNSLNFDLYYHNKKYPINLGLMGTYNIENYILCVYTSLLLDLKIEEIIDQTKYIKPVENRINFKIINDKLSVINNGYNSNIVGSLENIKSLNNFKNCFKIIITPGLVNLGKENNKSNLLMIDKINEICDLCIIVNKKNKKIFIDNLTIKYLYFDNFIKGYHYILDNIKENTILLIENDLTDKY